MFIGLTRATSVTFIDEHTLEAVTPAALPGLTPVTVRQFDGSEPVTLENAFTFTGEVEEAFDPILFPVFLPPTDGAFGSRFETSAAAWNKGIASVIVPVDPRYRDTLRIYSLRREPVTVTVGVNGLVHRQLTLTPGNDMFEPAYAELSDFPVSAGQSSMR